MQKSSPSELVYVADWTGSSLIHKMDHLACFIPAMLAVGAQVGQILSTPLHTLEASRRLLVTGWEQVRR